MKSDPVKRKTNNELLFYFLNNILPYFHIMKKEEKTHKIIEFN